MQITVLGGGGAWPTPERGCSGYLVEEADFRLLLDPGHDTFLELLKTIPASAVDAVFVSHGHADHCADLNPLLRARHLSEDPPAALPLFTLAGALDAVLSLDGQMLANDFVVNEFSASDDFTVGPFRLSTRALSHFVPNVGVRLSVGEIAVCYTGDGGADPGVVDLARDAKLLLAEATFAETVPEASRGSLASAHHAGEHASAAGVGQLVLTHLWPDTDVRAVRTGSRPALHRPHRRCRSRTASPSVVSSTSRRRAPEAPGDGPARAAVASAPATAPPNAAAASAPKRPL